MNRSIVTDGSGKEIFSYLKKEPYKLQKDQNEYKEYLDSSKNNEYIILEIDGIGRVGIGICKDLLSEDIKMFHKYIGTDILIIPSYTKSMDLQSSAEELSTEYNCVVVVANACSAFGEKNEKGINNRIGFISLPAKCGTDRTRITKKYCKNECVDECECKCIGKIIAVDFYHTEKYNNTISYVIKESQF
jgi:predicted amidohydrolase